MATAKDSAPAHPSTEDHDHQDDHQDERPCACLEGWVFVGYVDEKGVEREASYRCRRCSNDGSGSSVASSAEHPPPPRPPRALLRSSRIGPMLRTLRRLLDRLGRFSRVWWRFYSGDPRGQSGDDPPILPVAFCGLL